MDCIQNLRLQASNICIDIYQDFDEVEIRKENQSIQVAWEIGRNIVELLAKTIKS